MPPTTVQATVADDYTDLAELYDLPRTAVATEVVLQVSSQGAQLRLGDQTRPPTTANGLELQPGDTLGMGPVSPEAGWPLAKLWVRNDTAGSDATITLLGVVA